MMTVGKDTNGRLKLTFSQVAWAGSMLLGMGAAWAQINVRIGAVETLMRETLPHYVTQREVELMRENAAREHSELDRRMNKMETRQKHEP